MTPPLLSLIIKAAATSDKWWERPWARRACAYALLHLRRPSGKITHRRFAELPRLLRKGDLLVLNDARVIPARLLGKKRGTGGKVELLLVRPAAQLITAAALEAENQVEWQCLGQASKGLKPGAEVEFDGGLRARIAAFVWSSSRCDRGSARRAGVTAPWLVRRYRPPSRRCVPGPW